MGIAGINKSDGRLAWPETGESGAASTRETAGKDPGSPSEHASAGNGPAQSLGAWRKNRRPIDDSLIPNTGEADSLLQDTAPKIAQTPKGKLTGLQDVIDRFWINPGYY